MAGWGSAWDNERAAQCELQSVDFCKQKSEKTATGWSLVEKGGRYTFSLCVFHLACTRFLSLALLFVGFLLHVVGISEYKNGLRSHRKPDRSKLVFLQHPQKPRALSQAHRRDQWLALLAWAQAWHQGASTAWIKGRKRLSSSWIPHGRDMSSTSGSRSCKRGLLSFRSLSVGVLQRAVLRGGGDQGWSAE